MKKRIVCMALALVMTLLCATAFARDYTLSEKMAEQLDIGSGLKGSVSMSATGDSEAAKLISALFNGRTLEIRAIRSGAAFEYQAYFLTGETQSGETMLQGSETETLLTTALTKNKITLAGADTLADQLLGKAGGNPTWYTALQNFLKLDADVYTETWEPALADYEAMLEGWLNSFGDAPQVKRSETGETTLAVSYVIPADALKQEMKVILKAVLEDATLSGLLASLMNDGQTAAYLSASYGPYYAELIDGMTLGGDLQLDREVTLQGESVYTRITLPLTANDYGFDQFVLYTTDQVTDMTLSGESTFRLALNKTTADGEQTVWEGLIEHVPGVTAADAPEWQRRHILANFDLQKEETTFTEDDGREHVVQTWTLNVVSAGTATPTDLTPVTTADAYAFAPITVTANLEFNSKPDKKNPTHMLFDLSFVQGESTFEINSEFKTTSPWVMRTMDTAGAVAWSSMNDTVRKAYGREFTDGFLALAAQLAAAPVTTAAPATESDLLVSAETEAAPTETPAPTATPEAAGTEAPAAD